MIVERAMDYRGLGRTSHDPRRRGRRGDYGVGSWASFGQNSVSRLIDAWIAKETAGKIPAPAPPAPLPPVAAPVPWVPIVVGVAGVGVVAYLLLRGSRRRRA